MKNLSLLHASFVLASTVHSFSGPSALLARSSYHRQSASKTAARTRLATVAADAPPADETCFVEVERDGRGPAILSSRRAAIAGAGAALSALFFKGSDDNNVALADNGRVGATLHTGAGYSALTATGQGVHNKGLAATAAVAIASSADLDQYNTRVDSLPSEPAVREDAVATVAEPTIRAVSLQTKIRHGLKCLNRASLSFLRVAQIFALMMPVAALYPIVAAKKRSGSEEGERAHDRWLRLFLRQVNRSGAVMIKLFQWASSRPDMFGVKFCDQFKALQDSTTPHSWEHTEKAMADAFGEDWEVHVDLSHDVLGSGCIAQVYQGTITDNEGNRKPVAVKVVHPNVRKEIAKDLNILRFLAHSLERLPFGYGEKLRWNNLSGNVQEFSHMLIPQLDLRNEAEHLRRFNDNFASNPHVMFPEVVAGYEPHRDVLVESFCSGVPVDQFCREHEHDVELRVMLCDRAAETMCRMIFEHNYIHADLHPGNIFVSPDNKLILLDCGIVNEYSDADHDLLIKIIAAFIRMDGARAAELMADDSNRRLRESGEAAQNVEQYVADIEKISKTARTSDFFFEKVTTYVNYIFNAASKFKVQMNPSFVSMALAVKVQEGVALMLNPKGDIIHIANPIIKEAELRRLQTGNFDRIRLILDDFWRDFRVRQDREKKARISATAKTA